MMAKKQRLVRIMKAVRVKDDTGELVEEQPGDFWDYIIDTLQKRSSAPFFDQWHNGHDYRGLVVDAPRPMLYLAKQRNADDAPSQWEGVEGVPLTTPIHEPLFILPLRQTPAVAVLGTSGAATPVAVGRWLTGYLRSAEQGESIELHPVIRTDQREIMERAVSGTSLEISVDASEYVPRSNGNVEQGLALAANASDHLGTARIKVSMGRGNHNTGRAELLADARALIDNPALRTGKFRALIPDDDGNLRGEMLDLVSHRYTYKKDTGGTETSLSVQTAFPALDEAVTDFAKTDEYKMLRRRARVDSDG